MKHLTSMFAMTAAMLAAAPALAASDYLLEIDGVKGESAAPVAIESWSFGVCNQGACSSGSTKRTIVSPRDSASGQATGKRQHGPVRVQASQNSQSLRESPTRASTGKTSVTEEVATEKTAPRANWDLATNKGARTAGSGGGAGGGVNVATGDVDGDGLADLAFVQTQPEVSSLSFTFQKIEMVWRSACDGRHIDKAVLRSSSGDEYVITDAAVTCSSSATGQADALTDGLMILRFSSGQMKHTRTGHVTLLK